MPQVSFTGNLRRHRETPVTAVEGATVREALDAVFAEDPLLRGYVLDEQGRLRRHVNVFANNAMIADRLGLADPVGRDDEIYVLQALSGG